MADKQFYEFKLEADTTTESGSLPFINDLFSDIVNYDEVNPYYFNSGYKENLDHVPEEKSQNAKFGWTKALPYEKIPLWKWSGTTLVEDKTDYIITDAVFIDGVRYLMAVYADWTKMKIFKQIQVDELESCANAEYESLYNGRLVDISKYVYKDNLGVDKEIKYYPFNKCCDAKFTVAARGKGKKKNSGHSGYMKVEQTGEHVFYYFYDSNGPINAAAGDFLYINTGGLSGQIVPLSGSTTVDGHQGVETIFAWTGVNLSEGEEFGVSSEHGWVAYPEYGDILNFVCSDGLLHLNYSNEKPAETEVTTCGAMSTITNDNATHGTFLISSMCRYTSLDTIVLYDISDGDIKFGLSGFLKFYFKASNQYYISRDFTDVVQFSDYLVFVGPSKTGLGYATIDPNSAGVVHSMYKDIGDGYLTRGSWVSDDTTFILANAKGLWALELNAAYAVESRFAIAATWKFQGGPHITDLTHFSRELGDKMGMSMENKQFKMFIYNEEGTMIWIKSIEHNYRRQHIIPNYIPTGKTQEVSTQLFHYKAGAYLGNGVYDRGGNQEVKTYLAFSFGDKTMLIPKMLHSLKLAFGRDSWLTKDGTVMQITYTLAGRTYTVNYSDRDTAMWVQEMMNLKTSGNEDQQYRQYGNEMQISSGEGHGKFNPFMQYNVNKMRAFKEYDPHREVLSDFDDKVELANRASLHTDMGQMADIVTFKLFTRGKDNIEFYGAQIWYDLTNEVGGSLDNTIVIKASADDGSTAFIPK